MTTPGDGVTDDADPGERPEGEPAGDDPTPAGPDPDAPHPDAPDPDAPDAGVPDAGAPEPEGVIWANPAPSPFEPVPSPYQPPPWEHPEAYQQQPGFWPGSPPPAGQSPYQPALEAPEQPSDRRRRRRLVLRVIAGVVGLVLLLVVVLTASTPGLAPSGPADVSQSDLPPGATGIGGGIVLTSTGKPATMPGPGGYVLDVYEDYQCPYCGQFEESYGTVMKQLDRSGRARVVVHLLTVLDQGLGNDSSTRAALAATCAAAAGRFAPFHDALYANQPDQEGRGWTDNQLAGLARDAGLDGDRFDDWRRCTERRTYADYLRQVGAAAATAGVTSTPSFFVNGHRVDLRQVPPDQLLNAFGHADV